MRLGLKFYVQKSVDAPLGLSIVCEVHTSIKCNIMRLLIDRKVRTTYFFMKISLLVSYFAIFNMLFKYFFFQSSKSGTSKISLIILLNLVLGVLMIVHLQIENCSRYSFVILIHSQCRCKSR